mmetsp:Transcript_10256/g.38873  ORF Transcript_10256/g.38873 Transcript_10256/m.38873 type:complete len:101 (+) Transcript_10256:1016-1318(+)
MHAEPSRTIALSLVCSPSVSTFESRRSQSSRTCKNSSRVGSSPLGGKCESFMAKADLISLLSGFGRTEKSLREMSRRKMRRQWEWFSLFLVVAGSSNPSC